MIISTSFGGFSISIYFNARSKLVITGIILFKSDSFADAYTLWFSLFVTCLKCSKSDLSLWAYSSISVNLWTSFFNVLTSSSKFWTLSIVLFNLYTSCILIVKIHYSGQIFGQPVSHVLYPLQVLEIVCGL